MKKNLIIIAALAAAAGALLAYLLFAPEPEVRDSEDQWEPSLIIPEGLNIIRLTIEKSDLKITLQYQPDKDLWMMTEPIETLPDMMYLQLLRSDLSKLKQEKLIEAGAKDLGRYQLDPPAARFTIGFKEDHPDVILEVGKVTYSQDKFYAKLGSDDAVFLVPADIKQYLEATVNNFRSRALLLNSPGNMAGMEIVIHDPKLREENPSALEPKLSVQKDADNKPEWIIISPIREAADFETIKGFFFKLGRVVAPKVIDVPDGNYAAYGLDPPRARITFTFSNGTREEILFGNQTPDDPNLFYLGNSLRPDLVVVDQNFYRALLNLHFRNQYLIDSNRRLHLNKIVIAFPREPAKSFTLIQEPEEFIYHFQDQPDHKTVISLIRPFYKNLRQTVMIINHQAADGRKDMGLDPARLRITLYEKDQAIFDVSVGDTLFDQDQTYSYGEDHLRKFTFIIAGDPLLDTPPSGEAIIAKPEELERVRKIQKKRSD